MHVRPMCGRTGPGGATVASEEDERRDGRALDSDWDAVLKGALRADGVAVEATRDGARSAVNVEQGW